MKKILIFLFVLFLLKTAYSQNYQINFTGSGASSVVDSVKVENLTQCKNIIISGNNILHLLESYVGINTTNNLSHHSLNIYPNPLNGFCYVNFHASFQGNANIKLYDITGKIITNYNEFLSIGQHSYLLKGLNSGIYIIKIEADNYSYTSKIISNENNSNNIIQLVHNEEIINFNNNVNKPNENKSLVPMQYNTDDLLKFTGFSQGIYRTICTLVPTKTQSVNFNFVLCADADGNHYSTVQVLQYTFMGENLKSTKYRDGTSINHGWSSAATSGQYGCYKNDSATYFQTYGLLYNWFAGVPSVNNNKYLAPAGWHMPTEEEMEVIYNIYTGETGKKLKAVCTDLWPTNVVASNETGFTALPAGNFGISGDSYSIGIACGFWTDHECNTEQGASWETSSGDGSMHGNCVKKNRGYSVRCIKDY